MEKKTLGQQRLRVDFNPSGNELAARFKIATAELIDILEAMRNTEASKSYDKTPEEMQEMSGETFRLIATAQTKYEEAAMWAVKAATA